MIKKIKGFTMIELLATIFLILVLATLGYSTFNDQRKGAEDNIRRVAVDQIALNISQFKKFGSLSQNKVTPGTNSIFASAQELNDVLQGAGVTVPDTGTKNCILVADLEIPIDRDNTGTGFMVFTSSANRDELIYKLSNTIDQYEDQFTTLFDKTDFLNYIEPSVTGCPSGNFSLISTPTAGRTPIVVSY